MSFKHASQRPYLELTYELEKRSSISTRFANLGECESGLYSSPIGSCHLERVYELKCMCSYEAEERKREWEGE